ncbi:HU family DNA-binding protein, partial [Bacillus toyonensis]
MNKTELIQKVAMETGLKRPQASLAVDTVLES